MPLPSSVRGHSASLSALVALGLACLPGRAQTIPAIVPTAASVPAPAAISVSRGDTQSPNYRAKVEYSSGQLSVNASNSSLNQILREISRVTGMTITGGVRDERVFGSYGPADTSSILATLLDGTGSNMLLIQDARKQPRELVLTPRQGGPTPPNPNASRDEGALDLPPQFTPRISNQPGPPPEISPQAPPRDVVPPNAGSVPSAVPDAAPAAATDTSTSAPPVDTTTQPSTGGVKTPQQIYEQLMKLQQQQPKTPE